MDYVGVFMDSSSYLFLILGMGIVTYLPRWIPLFFLSNRKLPEWFINWLDLIPVAILSALLLPILITSGEPRHLEFFHARLLVAIPTFVFALKTRSLGGTVIVGMLLYWVVSKIII
jgi:branched-subunit amino acid transport protein